MALQISHKLLQKRQLLFQLEKQQQTGSLLASLLLQFKATMVNFVSSSKTRARQTLRALGSPAHAVCSRYYSTSTGIPLALLLACTQRTVLPHTFIYGFSVKHLLPFKSAKMQDSQVFQSNSSAPMKFERSKLTLPSKCTGV